jgi:hypothetical protein
MAVVSTFNIQNVGSTFGTLLDLNERRIESDIVEILSVREG